MNRIKNDLNVAFNDLLGTAGKVYVANVSPQNGPVSDGTGGTVDKRVKYTIEFEPMLIGDGQPFRSAAEIPLITVKGGNLQADFFPLKAQSVTGILGGVFKTATSEPALTKTTSVHGSNPDDASGSDGDRFFGEAIDGSPATLNTDSGSDLLIGNHDNDKLSAGAGHDYVVGNGGSDSIKGGDGNDRLFGDFEPGFDPATDPSNPSAGNDNIDAGDGNDSLFGGPGSDVLRGGSGNDILDGGAGNDVLDGGSGNETFIVSEGNDILAGGPGSDRIVFTGDFESVRIVESSQTSVVSLPASPFKVPESDVLDFSGRQESYTHILSDGTLLSTPGTLFNGKIHQGLVVANLQITPVNPIIGAADNAIQEVFHDGTQGTFTLNYDGVATTPLAFNAPPAKVKTALRAILPPGRKVEVTGRGVKISPWRITFKGTPTATFSLLAGNSGNLRHPGTSTGTSKPLALLRPMEDLVGLAKSSGKVQVELLGFVPGQSKAGRQGDSKENAETHLTAEYPVDSKGRIAFNTLVNRPPRNAIPLSYRLLVDFGTGEEHSLVVNLTSTQNWETQSRNQISTWIGRLRGASKISSNADLTVSKTGNKAKFEVMHHGETTVGEESVFLPTRISIIPATKGTVVVGVADSSVLSFLQGAARNTLPVLGNFSGKSDFGDVEKVVLGGGDHTFLFGNEYWGGDTFLNTLEDILLSTNSTAGNIPDLAKQLLPGLSQDRELTIDTSAAIAAGRRLVLDFRQVTEALEFTFNTEEIAAGKTITSLTVSKKINGQLPALGVGPEFTRDTVTFTNVDKNTIIYGGRKNNTYNVAPFAGTLIGGVGLAEIPDLFEIANAAGSIAGSLGLNTLDHLSNSLLVQNTLVYEGSPLLEPLQNLAAPLDQLGISKPITLASQAASLFTPGAKIDLGGATSKSFFTQSADAAVTDLSGLVVNIDHVTVGSGKNLVTGRNLGLVNPDQTVLEVELAGSTRGLDLGMNTMTVAGFGTHLLAGGTGADTYKFEAAPWGISLIGEFPDLIGALPEGMDTLDFSAIADNLHVEVFDFASVSGIINQVLLASGNDPLPVDFLGSSVVIATTEDFRSQNPNSPILDSITSFVTCILKGLPSGQPPLNFAIGLDIENFVGSSGSTTFHFHNGASIQGTVAAGTGGTVSFDYSGHGVPSGARVDLSRGADLELLPALELIPESSIIVDLGFPSLKFDGLSVQLGLAEGVNGNRFANLTAIPNLIGEETGGFDFLRSFSVASGANVIDSPFDDRLTRNRGNNVFTLSSGNDVVDGKDGNDTVIATSRGTSGVIINLASGEAGQVSTGVEAGLTLPTQAFLYESGTTGQILNVLDGIGIAAAEFDGLRLQATNAGTAGNQLTLRLVAKQAVDVTFNNSVVQGASAAAKNEPLSIIRTGNNVTVTLATDAKGKVISTLPDVVRLLGRTTNLPFAGLLKKPTDSALNLSPIAELVTIGTEVLKLEAVGGLSGLRIIFEPDTSDCWRDGYRSHGIHHDPQSTLDDGRVRVRV